MGIINGKKYKRVKCNFELKCPDCGALKGQYHSVGCDQESCPACKGQAITCKCEPMTASN